MCVCVRERVRETGRERGKELELEKHFLGSKTTWTDITFVITVLFQKDSPINSDRMRDRERERGREI